MGTPRTSAPGDGVYSYAYADTPVQGLYDHLAGVLKVNPTSGHVAYTMPAALGSKDGELTLVHIGTANNVVLSRAGSDKFLCTGGTNGGDTTLIITGQYSAVVLRSDKSGFWVVVSKLGTVTPSS